VGVGKAGDVIGAVRKGVADGKKHLVKVPLTRHSSVPTDSTGRDGAASVLIRPAAPGTGVIAGGSIRTVLELAGIKNVLAKRLGSKTPLNNARAAMVALKALRTHKETAKERGISLEQIYS
jgi:small subunit ribosomal protein S5